jgi:hypothetical protein
MTCILSLITVLGASGPGADRARAEELTGLEILERARDNKKSETQITELAMVLIAKDGKEQERTIRVWALQKGKESKTLTRFVKPRNVAGVGFLVHGEGADSQRWLYLPSMRKTRMIAEGDKDKSFMGTDFTYYDLSPHAVGDSRYDPVEHETVDGHDCYKVTGYPSTLETALYSKIVQWVRKDNFVPIAMDFYDQEGTLLKQSRVLELEEVDGNWTPMKLQMHNVQIDHRTVMTVEEIEYDAKIPGRTFEKSNLERGH